MPSKSQNGDVKFGVKRMSLELREEVKASKADLGDISIWISSDETRQDYLRRKWGLKEDRQRLNES